MVQEVELPGDPLICAPPAFTTRVNSKLDDCLAQLRDVCGRTRHLSHVPSRVTRANPAENAVR